MGVSMKPNNTIVILGGGKSQLPLVLSALKQGYDTLCFDIDPDAPAKAVSSKFIATSLYDYNAIIEVTEAYNPIAVLSNSSNPNVLKTYAKVCERFKLTGPNIELVNKLEDKTFWKNALESQNIKTPKWYSINGSLTKLPVSCFVKPIVGGRGSIGIEQFDRDTPVSALQPLSLTHFIEEKVEGPEYNLSGIIQNGRVKLLAISKKHHSNEFGPRLPIGYQSQIVSSSEYYCPTIEACCQAIGLDNSQFSLDVIDSKQGLFVIDFGCLFDARIDWALEHANIPIYDMLLDNQLKIPTRPIPESASKHFSLLFLYLKEVKELNIPELQNHKEDYSVFWENSGTVFSTPPESLAHTLGCLISSTASPLTWEALLNQGNTVIQDHLAQQE